jgi:hypothetical protein
MPVCNVSYATAHKACEARGRRAGRRTPDTIYLAAIRDLGYEVRQWDYSEEYAMRKSYPKKGILNITTHHPRRFPKQWANTGAVLMRSRGHITACIDGQVQDWAINSSKQVFCLWTVTKKGA